MKALMHAPSKIGITVKGGWSYLKISPVEHNTVQYWLLKNNQTDNIKVE